MRISGGEAARSVGNKEGFDAQFVHDANGESHLLHVISLVVVETSLHGKHFFTAQTAEKETTGVTFYRGNGEMGDVSVRKLLDASISSARRPRPVPSTIATVGRSVVWVLIH